MNQIRLTNNYYNSQFIYYGPNHGSQVAYQIGSLFTFTLENETLAMTIRLNENKDVARRWPRTDENIRTAVAPICRVAYITVFFLKSPLYLSHKE